MGEQRKIVKSVLLCLHRVTKKLPSEALLKVLLPMVMNFAWVSPQDIWDLEDRDNMAALQPA